MDIVACLDKGFVMPTGVMMYSVCTNNQETEIMFHLVVDESVTGTDQLWKGLGSLSLHTIVFS
jgi:lipopolysaccharide biosynthesis glycosyltransferase